MKRIKSKLFNVRSNSSQDWEVLPIVKGKSAYEVAVENGYQGTEQEWINSLSSIDDQKNERKTTLSSRESANRFANAFVGNESGMTIAVDDVSSQKHDVACRVESKNFLPLNHVEIKDPEYNLTVFETNVITFSGGTEVRKVQALTDWRTIILEQDVVFSVLYKNGVENLENFYIQVDSIYDGQRHYNDLISETDFSNQFTTKSRKVFKKGTLINRVYLIIKPLPAGNNIEILVQAEKSTSITPCTNRIADLSIAKLYQSGKNLLDDQLMVQCGFTQIGKHEFYVKESNVPARKVLLSNPAGITGVFTIRYEMKYVTNTSGNSGVFPVVHFKDGTRTELRMHGWEPNLYGTALFKSPEGKIVDYIDFSFGYASTETYFKNFEVCYGESNEKFTPNDTTVFSPDPNGLVTGMETKGNAMVILSDTPGTIANIQYNKDPNIVVSKLSDRIAALEAAAIPSEKPTPTV